MPIYVDIPLDAVLPVEVSAADIAAGQRRSVDSCPLAQAILRQGYRWPFVSGERAGFWDYELGVHLVFRVGLRTWVRLVWYDRTGRMRPFTARLRRVA